MFCHKLGLFVEIYDPQFAEIYNTLKMRLRKDLNFFHVWVPCPVSSYQEASEVFIFSH